MAGRDNGHVPDPSWPLFDLRVRTPRLELRPDWDGGLADLAAVAAAGVHDPADMPFFEPWTDAAPGDLERSTMQFCWGRRAALTPDDWHVNFVVLRDGRVVGLQSVQARQFAVTRTVETGSWLGRVWQGQGIGTEMRAAVLHVAFAGLGAQRALSGAFEDNAPSLAVSRVLGYVEHGDEVRARRGRPARAVRFLLTREEWERRQPPFPINVDGLEPCRPLLGA